MSKDNIDKNAWKLDIFREKMHIVNPDIMFENGAWISSEMKIKGYCKLHRLDFIMFRNGQNIFYNCPLCKVDKKYTKEEKEKIRKQLKELEIDLKEKREEEKLKEKIDKLTIKKLKITDK